MQTVGGDVRDSRSGLTLLLNSFNNGVASSVAHGGLLAIPNKSDKIVVPRALNHRCYPRIGSGGCFLHLSSSPSNHADVIYMLP